VGTNKYQFHEFAKILAQRPMWIAQRKKIPKKKKKEKRKKESQKNGRRDKVPMHLMNHTLPAEFHYILGWRNVQPKI